MLTPSNTQFKPPIPDSLVVNDGQGLNMSMTPGQTYRVRMVNFAAFGAAMVHFDSHNMNIVMNDGEYVQKEDAYHVRLAPAQRYDVLLSCANSDTGNYPYLVSLDLNRDWTNSSSQLSWPHNYTGYLVTNSSQPANKLDVVDKWKPVDDAKFKPYDGASKFDPYNTLIKLDFKFCFDQNGYPR
jgi:iron transport multicopper oxidase